jgi:choline kinase
MKGLIAAAGLSTRLLDLCDRQNKVLLDLGGESILSTILTHLEHAAVSDTLVVVGYNAIAVRTACAGRARCVLNPFFEHQGLLSSLWAVRGELAGQSFVFTPGDHYFAQSRLSSLLSDQPLADVLVDVELNACDNKDVKVYLNKAGRLRTLSKAFLDGPVLGAFTGLVRFSAEGSQQFFTTFEKHVWQHGLQQSSLAELLCHLHKRWELGFHLSGAHDRVAVNFPCDVARASELYALERRTSRRAG